MTDTADITTIAAHPPVERDGVLEITISSGGAMPALDREAMVQGAAALREITTGDREIGAILLRGPGANFCAGGNVQSFADAEDRPAFLGDLADTFHTFVLALVAAERPVVVAATGWAAGAGMSLVLLGDLVVVGNSTKLKPAYPRIGLSPDGGMSWTLPRAVGAARARAIILTDRTVTATEAQDWGIAAEIVADDAVLDRAQALATRLAGGSHASLAATTRLLADSATTSLAEHLDAEARSISRLSGLPEGREGVDAFVQKRAADFAAARRP